MRQFSWLLGVFGLLLLVGFGVYAGVVDKVDTPWAVGGGVGLALFIAWLILDHERLARGMAARGARYSAMAVGLLAVTLGIVVAANVLGFRHDRRWDLTSTQQFALAPQSVAVVGGLNQEVEVLAFFTAGGPEEMAFKDLVGSYSEHTTLLKVTYLDPVREPMAARQNEVTSAYGTVILKAGAASQRLESAFNEEAVTNALIRLSSSKEHRLCFATGHDELDPDEDSAGTGLGAMVTKMEGQNYTVRKVDLAREGGVDATCEVLVVASPQTEWLPHEREMLAAYLAGGGSVVALLDPLVAPALTADMARYGLSLSQDIVLEQNPKYQLVGGDASYILLDKEGLAGHPLTDALKGGILMRVARSVAKGADVAGLKVTELGFTTEYGWGETDLTGTTTPEPTPGVDRVGKVPLMAIVEVTDAGAIKVGPRTLGSGDGFASATGATPAAATPAATEAPVTRVSGGRLLVIGDADFTSNELLDQLGNQDLLQNAVAWMVGEVNQVSIRPNAAGATSFTMDLVSGVVVWLLCLVIAPGLMVVGALAAWMQRRNL